MAGGWARDGAVQDQIDDTVRDAVEAARARLGERGAKRESRTHCIECDEPIPEGRRKAIPGVTKCVACQSGDDRAVSHSAINRRGSKDSQLR